jgi:DNA-directed RNA polymerase subunit omega
MEKLNTDMQVDSKITSRYTIVLAVAKRARQIIDGSQPLTYAPTDRAVSIAVKEMGEGKIKINMEVDALDENYERLLALQNRYKNISTATSDDLREDLKDNYDPPSYTKDDDDDIEVDNFKDGFTEEGSEDEFLYDDDFGKDDKEELDGIEDFPDLDVLPDDVDGEELFEEINGD